MAHSLGAGLFERVFQLFLLFRTCIFLKIYRQTYYSVFFQSPLPLYEHNHYQEENTRNNKSLKEMPLDRNRQTEPYQYHILLCIGHTVSTFHFPILEDSFYESRLNQL